MAFPSKNQMSNLQNSGIRLTEVIWLRHPLQVGRALVAVERHPASWRCGRGTTQRAFDVVPQDAAPRPEDAGVLILRHGASDVDTWLESSFLLGVGRCWAAQSPAASTSF